MIQDARSHEIKIYKIIFFAGDTSLNVSNPNHNVFQNDNKMIFKKFTNGLILACSR
jgi:hypothetical protein